MFVRIGKRIINTSRIVEARVIEAYGDHHDEEGFCPARPLRVFLSMTGLDEEGNGREIVLSGEEGRHFLAALPVYEPTADDGEGS